MTVVVASRHELSRSLLDLIGCEITQPPATREMNKGILDQLYGGGFTWQEAQTEHDRRAATRTLLYHEPNHWLSSLAPEGLVRLRYLSDPEQAGFAFRFPVVIDGEPIPGFPAGASLPFISSSVSGEGVTIGRSRYGEAAIPIRLGLEDRRRHCYIQGATGTGKTTLIQNMALQDMRSGLGVIVVDWHGDLCLDLLRRIPMERIADVIYFNPADTDYPVGLNLLSYDPYSRFKEQHKERIIDVIISYVQREYPAEMVGPIFLQNVRNGLHLIMANDEEAATLLDLPVIFLDEKLMRRKLEALKSPIARKFWEDVYNSKDYRNGRDGASLLQYIISKFSPFVDMALTRNIFGQASSKLDFRQVLDGQMILLCNFSKGLIGESFARFLGFITLLKVEQAVLSRAAVPERNRLACSLFLDECHNLQTEHFPQLLSEMRKYGVNITLSNQHFSQIDEKMRDAVLGNCGTLVIFKTGVRDAAILEPAFYPFNRKLLVRQSNFHAAVKTLVDGKPQIFTMETLPSLAEERDEGSMQAIIERSRLKYGRNREDVEREIFSRLGWGQNDESRSSSTGESGVSGQKDGPGSKAQAGLDDNDCDLCGAPVPSATSSIVGSNLLCVNCAARRKTCS